MDAEDICIISTPQPRRYRQNSAAIAATIYHQQQSGKKRRAPHRRIQLPSKEGDLNAAKSAQNDDDEMPAAKRFKHSPTAIKTSQQRQLTPTATDAKKDEMGRGRSRAHTPVTPKKSILHSPFQSPQGISQCRHEEHHVGNQDDGDDNNNEASGTERFVTPPRRQSGLIISSPAPLGLNHSCWNKKTPTRVSSPRPDFYVSELQQHSAESPRPMFHDPYKTPRRDSLHRDQQTLSSGVHNATPPRASAKTPEHRRGSTPNSRCLSPVTPCAPLRARRDGRHSLVQAILSGNKRQVEAALTAGEDPNEEIFLPIRDYGESTMISPVKRQKILPLLAAAKLSTSASVIEKLIVHGAIANSVNSVGQTALHLICQQKLNKQRRSLSQIGSDTPKSCCTSPTPSAKPIPQSWLKLQEFFETLSPELPHDPSLTSTGIEVSTRMATSTKIDGEGTNNMGTPKFIRTRAQNDNERANYEFSGIKESELALNVNMLLRYGTDKERKDVHGRTAAEYAKANGLWTLYEMLRSDQQGCGRSHDFDENSSGSTPPQKAKKIHAQSSPIESRSASRGKSLFTDINSCVAVRASRSPPAVAKPATPQASLLSFFPLLSPHNNNPCRDIDDGLHRSSLSHNPRGGMEKEVQPESSKEVEPPDRQRDTKSPALLPSMSTQTRRSHHKGTTPTSPKSPPTTRSLKRRHS